MKRFKCTVERTDEYIIEFDENIYDERWIEDFKRYFYDFDDLKEHAEHIAQFRARFGDHSFIEGYGIPLVNGKVHWSVKDKEKNKEIGINIKIISEDDDCYVDVEELEEEN